MALSFYLDDDSVVKEPIEQRRGHHWVAKNVTPFGEAAIRGEDYGAALLARVDELEEQIAAARDDGQVSDLLDDQQRVPAQDIARQFGWEAVLPHLAMFPIELLLPHLFCSLGLPRGAKGGLCFERPPRRTDGVSC